MPSIVQASASLSVVGATPSEIDNDGVDVATVTLVVLDGAGDPIVGVPAAQCVLAVSGTGNTVTQPTGFTDANGEITGSFVTTTAEAKSCSWAVAGLAVTQTAAVTAVGGAVAVWLEENFSTYSSTANMLADPRGIYTEGEDSNAAQIVLDTAEGYDGLTQCMRYDWPDRSGVCSDYTIGRNLTLPSAVAEVWIEAVIKFSAVWSTVNAGCGGISNPDYKFMFGRINGMSSRFETVLGNGGNAIINGYPSNEEADTVAAVLSDLVDEQWHVFRWHWKVGTGDGVDKMWIDGVLQSDLTAISTGTTTSIYGLGLGRNMNQGPDQTQTLQWGRIRLYNTNPGWV